MTLSESVLAQRSARVLLAEDDREMRTLLARILRRANIELVEATNGEDALARIYEADHAARPHPFDLVIADIRMPGCSGLDLLARLRERDWKTPVILITGFGNPETHAEAKRLGAYAIFDKPFDFDDLKNAMLNATPLEH
jgi:DNA-binding NtrC family response regulator